MRGHGEEPVPDALARNLGSARTSRTSFIRMPPLGTLGYDANGAALVDQWIEQLRCE
jgi:hypothetical protein